MGSSLSSRIKPPCPPTQTVLSDLPESCVASILLHLDPQQICRLATLNRAFYSASSADFVWERKLPPNYQSLAKRVFLDDYHKGDNRQLSKKEVYARLCRPTSFDGDAKRVWLDKSTARVCISIASHGLAITGIDDRRYWSRIPMDESRCGSVAYLQQTWWFQVAGEVEFPFPPGSYSLFFRLQLGRPSRRFGRLVCDTNHVHGWDKKPVQFQLSTSEGQQAKSQRFLLEGPGRWIFYHAGDFMVISSKPIKVKFSMTQIDCTHTKGGLCVDSVLIYPSEFRARLKLF